MQQILIACGDIELLRKIVGDLPQNTFKPIATKTGEGIVQKVSGRDVPVALVYEQLADDTTGELLRGLKQLDDGPAVIFLSKNAPPSSGPFDRALRYPVPGPVLRNAIKALTGIGQKAHDLEKWRLFYRELKARLEGIEDKTYYQVLGLPPDVPHHRLQKAYDVLSKRYHPDRYSKYRSEKWGKAIHELTTNLYKEMTEAYGILSDRKLRKKYDRVMQEGGVRLDSEDMPSDDRGPKSLEALGKTSGSRKFLKLAQTDLASGNLSGALQNLQFAQSMESDNRDIAEKIEEIKQKMG
jgi:hypothetical protein